MALTSSILIFGHDGMLLDTRRWVLEKAGFTVMTGSAMPDAIQTMTQDSPALLILCHTLKPAERRSVLAAAASLRPSMKTLSICFGHWATDEEGIVGETLDMFAGPGALIAATRKLVP